jgi:hypothetical protein
MKRLSLLAISWTATFFGGHALGASTKVTDPDPYYYCAARDDTCQGSEWAYYDWFEGWCCCDLNSDQIWKNCYATIYIFSNPPYYNQFCYRLLGGWNETNGFCLPDQVAQEPIQPLDWECGCTMAPRNIAEMSTVTSPGSGQDE